MKGFRTPSGNIVCGQYTTGMGTDEVHQWLTCGIASTQEAWQLVNQAGEGHSLGLRAATLPEKASVATLGYEATWATDDFQCASHSSNLLCENRFGNGFSLSREKRDGW